MTTIRIFLLSSVLTLLCPFSIIANNSSNNYLQTWQATYLNSMSPEELQLTANFLYLSYAIALVELKVRQFATPLSRLHQSIRTNIANYKNSSDELAMFKTLIERLSYVVGARSIYIEMLTTCTKYYNDHTTQTINAALESIQLDAQVKLRAWADERNEKTTTQLKNFSEIITNNIHYFQGASQLHKNMSEGVIPFEIAQENEHNKSILILDLILKSNLELLMVTDNVTNALNETSDYAAQIIAAGAEIYKNYYVTIHNMITAPTFDKNYATTMFSMHDLLPREYKTLLPSADHVFEHMLQTTKLYTQAELLQQQ